MNYLDRLRAGDAGKSTPSLLQEPQKDPSRSFCSSHVAHFQKSDPSAPCTACGCGSHWQDADGWHCESREPAPDHVTRWCNVSGGKTAPMPAPVVAWPDAMTADLRRVSVHFEWTRQDIADFCRWARRSPEALADAREFLAAHSAKLPTRPYRNR